MNQVGFIDVDKNAKQVKHAQRPKRFINAMSLCPYSTRGCKAIGVATARYYGEKLNPNPGA
jgi:hypothetical protein